MSKVELRQVIGLKPGRNGKVVRVGWDMDILLLDGVQIATINRRPGSQVGLLGGVELTPSQIKAVEDAVAKARGGVKPSKIGSPIKAPYEILDDEETDDEGDDTDETELSDE